MKQLLAVFILLTATCLCAGGDLPQEPYRHKATGLVFPVQLAALAKGDVTDYESKHPGLGISVGYDRPGITATIYLYTLNLKSVPADLAAPVMQQHFKLAAGEVLRTGKAGTYADLKQTAEEEVDWGAPQQGTRALHAAFSFTVDSTARLSHLYLTSYRDYFLKVRFTYAVSARTEAEAVLKELLEALGTMTAGAAGVAAPVPGGPSLADAARTEPHLPAKGELTLATAADIRAAATVAPEVKEAIGAYLKPQKVDWQIVAARNVGKHILLWIAFPKIADGGIDLIYSAEQKKIVGEFHGGERG